MWGSLRWHACSGMFLDVEPLEHDRALSRAQFEERFPDDAACADHLARRRWPNGFVCPGCGGAKGWALKTKAFTWECAACRRQTSVTAGTIMHASHLPLKVWFTAIHIVTSHSDGVSALQLQAQLGLGSYKSAWLLLQKLRRAMVDPGRGLLEGVVEIDETEIPLRGKDDPLADFSATTLRPFVAAVAAPAKVATQRPATGYNMSDDRSEREKPSGFIGAVA